MSVYSEVISDFVINLNNEDIPEEVIYRAKILLLDALGVAVSGSQNTIVKESVVKTVRDISFNNRESTVIQSNLHSSSDYAAFANASMIHCQDFDDTHRLGVVHTSSIVAPTALACGEAKQISGKALLESLVAGHEIFARIGMAANEGFHKKGMHATPMCGIFVASLISGKINNLTVEELTNALGICGSQSAGIQQFLIDGSWVKIIHPSWAIHSGIIASKLAANGFRGPLEIFEGKLGFFACHLGLENVKLEELTKGLGEAWETLNISIKRYPCCHAIHTFIDGVLYIQANHDIKWNKIKHITCKVNTLGKKLVCDPIEIKRQPKTAYGGRFSLPYAIAITLLDGELGLEQFTEEKIRNPQVLEITKKIDCIEDSAFPRTGGNISIEMEDGSQFKYVKEHPFGSPLYPLDESQVIDKFKRNVRGIVNENHVEQIIENILNIENVDNVRTIMALVE